MTRLVRAFIAVLLVAQTFAAVRIVIRLIRTAGGERITANPTYRPGEKSVSVIVPVLNEELRLEPCLAGLAAHGPEIGEILVVDGGSRDGTGNVVARWSDQDSRIRWLDASPIPEGWNGKPWGLDVGAKAVDPAAEWVLTIDADVRPQSGLIRALMAHAERLRLDALSVATPQIVSDWAEAPVHSSLLATLVYRYGIPGQVFDDPEEVQANGQCFLISRNALREIGGFAAVRGDLVEDVALARRSVRFGQRYGFFETEPAGSLVTVEMYGGWYDALSNWSRSLPMRDRQSGLAWKMRMAEMTLVQGLALALFATAAAWNRMPWRGTVLRFSGALLMVRYGMQAGMSRAYLRLPLTHWLAVVADPVVVLMVILQATRRVHRWRGRTVRWDDPT